MSPWPRRWLPLYQLNAGSVATHFPVMASWNGRENDLETQHNSQIVMAECSNPE